MKEDTKQFETLSYKPICSICKKVSCQCRPVLLKENLAKPSSIKENTPLENLKIIEEIEGLMSKVNEKLSDLNHPAAPATVKRANQIKSKSYALEEVDLFQKTTLCELRKAFE